MELSRVLVAGETEADDSEPLEEAEEDNEEAVEEEEEVSLVLDLLSDECEPGPRVFELAVALA